MGVPAVEGEAEQEVVPQGVLGDLEEGAGQVGHPHLRDPVSW